MTVPEFNSPAPAPAAEPLADLVVRLTHDMASPLMIVTTLTELLLEHPGLDAQQRRDMHQIFAAAEEAASIARALRAQAQRERPADA